MGVGSKAHIEVPGDGIDLGPGEGQTWGHGSRAEQEEDLGPD